LEIGVLNKVVSACPEKSAANKVSFIMVGKGVVNKAWLDKGVFNKVSFSVGSRN
jgi:hypothetical protein